MIITIDGPAGSGKSSTAKEVAQRLSIKYIDSGALYRWCTLVWLRAEKKESQFFEVLNRESIDVDFSSEGTRIWLNGTDVSEAIRSNYVTEHVSIVAKMAQVRSKVNETMRSIVEQDVFIADGRDLGTAVFPDAKLKFFLIADVKTRAQRRFLEMKSKGMEANLADIEANIQERDRLDSTRSIAPLKQPEDAQVIDTSNCSFTEQVEEIVAVIERANIL